MGRKAYGSHRDSRVAEISRRYSAPRFFCAVSGGNERQSDITVSEARGLHNDQGSR